MLKHSSSRIKKMLAVLFAVLFVVSTTAVAVSAHHHSNQQGGQQGGSPHSGPSGIWMHQLRNNPGGMGYGMHGYAFIIGGIIKFKQQKDNHPQLAGQIPIGTPIAM